MGKLIQMWFSSFDTHLPAVQNISTKSPKLNCVLSAPVVFLFPLFCSQETRHVCHDICYGSNGATNQDTQLETEIHILPELGYMRGQNPNTHTRFKGSLCQALLKTMQAEVIKLSIEWYRLTGVEAGKTLSTWLNNRALRLRGLDALHSDDGRRGGAYELMSSRCAEHTGVSNHMAYKYIHYFLSLKYPVFAVKKTTILQSSWFWMSLTTFTWTKKSSF